SRCASFMISTVCGRARRACSCPNHMAARHAICAWPPTRADAGRDSSMKRAAAILLGVATVCLVAYLSWLNPAEVEFRLAPTYAVAGRLGPLMVFAFLIGAIAVLAVVSVQA